jgi:dienelactone hydrolase
MRMRILLISSLLAVACWLVLISSAEAKVVTQTLEYEQGGVALEGYLAYNNEFSSLRPGVLIVHQWMGLGEYEKGRARQLAELGYVALAADIYGKGVRPSDPQSAGAEAGKYRNDRALLRARVQAGLDALKGVLYVDPTRIAAIGYCFGGGAVLELARSGAELEGVVSFHGNLDTLNADDAKNIHTKLLVLHGADDPHVTQEAVQAFIAEMKAAQVDWQLVEYSGAVHAFTDPSAGNDPSKGAAYNASADKRSWQAMLDFFGEIFQ